MEPKTYKALARVHFEQKLWHNELEMIEHEVDFFLQLLEQLSANVSTEHRKEMEALTLQMHHFQRTVKRIEGELDLVEQEMAEGVMTDNVLDKEQRLDHQYMQEEMQSLEYDYRMFKEKFRSFVVKAKSANA